MKKIVSLVAILCMIFSLSVFAINNDGAVTYYTESDTVSPGDKFTVLVNVKGDTDTTVGMKAGSFTLTYPTDLVTLVADECSCADTGLSTQSMNTNTAGKVVVNHRPGADDTYPTGDFTFVTLTFTVNDNAAGSIEIGTSAMKTTFAAGSTSYNYTTKNTLTIAIESGSTDIIVDGEDFSSATDGACATVEVEKGNVKVGSTSIAMGEGGKIYTFFKKSDKALEAGKYGIDATINEKKFRFPGKVDVTIASGETEAKWAIKLVIPTGKFIDGVAASVTNITAYTID